jgi:hypothetical protein
MLIFGCIVSDPTDNPPHGGRLLLLASEFFWVNFSKTLRRSIFSVEFNPSKKLWNMSDGGILPAMSQPIFPTVAPPLFSLARIIGTDKNRAIEKI